MFRFNLAVAALSALALSSVNAAPPAPLDRLYAQVRACKTETEPGQQFAQPCFHCMNIGIEGGENEYEGPRILDAGSVPITPSNRTEAPTYPKGPVPKSMYTHCFPDSEKVYQIFYEDMDCEGQVVMDQMHDDLCPECDACQGYEDCGQPGCDRKCCGFMPECSQCQNAFVCSMFGDECTGCPGCKNENPNCFACTDSLTCQLYGPMCAGCDGCNNPADPCKLCQTNSTCLGPTRDLYCNSGNCPACAGVDPCTNCQYHHMCNEKEYPGFCNKGDCPKCKSPNEFCYMCTDAESCQENGNLCYGCQACTSSPPDDERRLKDASKSNFNNFWKNSIPNRPASRNLESTSNFTNNAFFGVMDVDDIGEYGFASLYGGPDCERSALLGGGLAPGQSCLSIPEELDNITQAIRFQCSPFSESVTFQIGHFESMGICESSTASSALLNDGECYTPPSGKFSISVECTGWGRMPPPPPPPNEPEPGDLLVVKRVRYPDRRCATDTGKLVPGEIMECGKCTAFPGKTSAFADCEDGEVRMYSAPGCSEADNTLYVDKCEGLGPIRGIFKLEKESSPKDSYAFFSAHFGHSGCYSDNVVVNVGTHSNECTLAKGQEGGEDMFVSIDCSSHTLSLYPSEDCSGDAVYTTTFVDNECEELGEFGAKFRASCDGYQELLTAPPTDAPSSAPVTPAPTQPTESPTSGPTLAGETKSPTKKPTESPTSPTFKAPSKAPVTATPTAPTKRTCAAIPRGCSKNEAGACAGKSATWVVEGETGSCECASTDKASKVVFKLKVEATTVAAFNADECNVADFFRGVYNKVYEKTKSSIVSDYPVEVQTAPVQSGSDVVVEFAVHGFLDTSVADAVVSYIDTETASFVAAVEAAAANALGGDGAEISYVTGSASRVDDVSFCGCKNLIDNVGSGAISNIQSNYLAQAIVAGIVAFAANQ